VVLKVVFGQQKDMIKINKEGWMFFAAYVCLRF
jgi:hypothetical protein